MSSTPGPVAPGESITYKLLYGNIGSISPSNVNIKMPIPDGTSFLSATDGGIVQNDTITWNIGQLGVGNCGDVQLKVTTDKDLNSGQIVSASASIDPNLSTEYVVKSSTILPIHSELPLKLDFGINQSVTTSNGATIISLTVTNSGTENLQDVKERFLFPTDIYNDYIIPNVDNFVGGQDIDYFDIGNLAPGESRTYFIQIFYSSRLLTGDVKHMILIAKGSNTEQSIVNQDILIDDSPSMLLRLSRDSNPVIPGKPISYTLTYGNVGSGSPSDVILTMPIPEGTDFVSASNGGTLKNGKVKWDIGLLGAGESNSVRVTVTPDAGLPDGTIIKAEAELDPGSISTENSVKSSSVTTVHSQLPLHVNIGINQATTKPANQLTYYLTATNSGTKALLDLTTDIIYENSFVKWNIGTLLPGQSKHYIESGKVPNNVINGGVSQTILLTSGSNVGQVTTSSNLSIDSDSLLHISIASGPNPVTQGERFPYTIAFGNPSNLDFSGVILRAWIPDGTVFDSASYGGFEQDGVVTWNIKHFNSGTGGKVKLWVKPNDQLPDGSLLKARANLSYGTNFKRNIYSKTLTPVRGQEPLKISFKANKSSVSPGDSVTYTIKATNNGSVNLLDLSAFIPETINTYTYYFDLPTDFDTDNLISGTRVYKWDIGNLAPGQSKSVSLNTKIREDAQPGEIQENLVYFDASNAGMSQAMQQQNVLIGSLVSFNQPPSVAVIQSPPDSASLVVGGSDGSAPLPSNTPFVVRWDHSTDPENDAVTYHWQLSASNNFSSPLIDAASANNGKDTLYQTTYGNISKILSDNGVAVGDSIMLYHRVVASDGGNQSMSDTLHITLTRGTLTGIEQQTGLPTVLALHDNYPNPFNPTTTIRYDLPKAGVVRLTVFDVLGRQVAELINSQQAAGKHSVIFNASRLASGVYFYRLSANNHILIKKMLLMK